MTAATFIVTLASTAQPSGEVLVQEVGDEAVLLGRQGDEQIDAEEMAAWLDTISYEVLCSPSKRVPRVYINA